MSIFTKKRQENQSAIRIATELITLSVENRAIFWLLLHKKVSAAVRPNKKNAVEAFS